MDTWGLVNAFWAPLCYRLSLAPGSHSHMGIMFHSHSCHLSLDTSSSLPGAGGSALMLSVTFFLVHIIWFFPHISQGKGWGLSLGALIHHTHDLHQGCACVAQLPEPPFPCCSVL